MNAVTASLGADIHNRIVSALGRSGEDFVLIGDAETEDVDKDVSVVARVEVRLAAHCRHANAIAVKADAAHHAVDELPRLRMLRRAEAQRVHDRNRTRSHRKNVAQDAADAGRRALERFDEARVVVALHLEDGGEPLANIDGAGVLARPVDHVRRLGRKLGQMHPRGFVRAVLAPHDREDAQLGGVRRAAELLQHEVVLIAGKAEFFGEGQCAWRERV